MRSLPDGYAIRPASLDDLDGVAEMLLADDLADTGQSDFDADFLRDQWSSPGLDLSVDAWVVTDPRSTIVGHANVAPEGDGKLKSWGLVHPDHRGRGLGSVLLDRIESARGGADRAGVRIGLHGGHRRRRGGSRVGRLPRVRTRAVVPTPPARPGRTAARTRRAPTGHRDQRHRTRTRPGQGPRDLRRGVPRGVGLPRDPVRGVVEPRGRDDQLRPEPVAPRHRRGRGGRGALGRRVGRPGLGRRARRAEALAWARDRVGAAAARVRDVRRRATCPG